MSAQEVKDLERQAEEAFTAMYEVDDYAVKDCYDDARRFFRQAMNIALDDGMTADADRLGERLHHLQSVYLSKFRNAGR